MKTQFHLALLLTLVCSPLFTSAQQYVVKESETSCEDFFHDFFAVNASPQKYVVVNYAGRHGAFSFKRDELNTSIDIYNAQLKQVFNNPIKELKGKKYIAGFSTGTKIFLFYFENENNVFRIELNPDNGNAAGAPEKLLSVRGQNFSFYHGHNADSSYYYLICTSHDDKSKDEKYDGIILDRQMHIFNTFSFVINGMREYTARTVFALSGKGILDVISAIRIKTEKSNYDPLIYEVRQINKDGLEFNKTLKDMPEGLVANVIWQNKDDKLEFTGLLSKSKKEGYTAVVSGTFDAQDQKIVDIKNSPINLSLLQNMPKRFVKDISKDGIPADAIWTGSYLLKDGSWVMMVESNSLYFDSYGVPKYQSENVYVLKINPAKELEWIKVIPKNQWEIAGKYYTGIISVKTKDDGIHIYFHDYIKNVDQASDSKPDRTDLDGGFKKISLADVFISKEGKMSKQFIFDDSGSDYHLSTDNVLLLPGEIVFTSFYRRNLGKSQYRIGVISMK